MTKARFDFPLFCLDMEGVLWPEAWKALAKQSGVDEFKLTTQDVSSFDELMKIRINALRREKITLADMQKAILPLKALDGALAFLQRLEKIGQVIIISDTFRQFLEPVHRELNRPMVFCNTLQVSEDGYIEDYIMRSSIGKKGLVASLSSQGYTIGAAGDSFNDVGMIEEARWGCFIHAPERVRKVHPHIQNMNNYDELYDYWYKCLFFGDNNGK